MIALVEGAKRQENTQRNRAGYPASGHDDYVFAGLCDTCRLSRCFLLNAQGKGTAVSVTVLIALLVCLAPTTIGGLLSAIGIAGMNRLIAANVIATSGRAVGGCW